MLRIALSFCFGRRSASSPANDSAKGVGFAVDVCSADARPTMVIAPSKSAKFNVMPWGMSAESWPDGLSRYPGHVRLMRLSGLV